MNSAGAYHGYLLKPALPGDANLDAKVDINDLSRVLTNYDRTVGSGISGWAQADFNNDGKVNLNDLSIVLTNYDESAALSAGGMATVPEPSTVLLAVLGLFGAAVACRGKR